MELFATVKAKGAVFDGRAPGIIRKALTSAMSEAVMFLEAKVKANLPTEVDGVKKGVGVFGDQGGLRSRIHGEVEKGRSIFKGMAGNAVITGIVGHMSAYGDVIEKGRRAGKGMPPKGSLVRWIELKFGPTLTVKAKGGKERTITAAQAEFMFRRSIAKKGFKGIHMFERALKDNLPAVAAIFERYGFIISKSI